MFSLLVATVIVAVSSALINRSYGQTNLFPFGGDNDDLIVPTGIAASDISILNEPITFFGHQYRQIIVNANGVLSLGGEPFTSVSQDFFPLSSRDAIIAPFWFDLDSTRGGSISYRQSSDTELLQRMSSLVQGVNDGELVDFHPTQLFIATWYQVASQGSLPEMSSTFQVVLGTDTSRTVSLFIYDDIQSGSGAQIGFNAGDGINSFSLPGVLTSQTLDMEQHSNIGVPGVFVYCLDNLGSVMCSSMAGCTSYDLGNTTQADCCRGSTEGKAVFNTLPGTKDCNRCYFDVDECDLGRHDCSTNARCFNTPGSFDCVCNPLYMGDGRNCQESATLIIIIGSVLGVAFIIILIGGLVVALVCVSCWSAKRLRTNRQQLNNLQQSVNEVDSDLELVNIRGMSVQISYKLELPPHLILPSSCIKLVEPIGQGEFGIVYKGYIMKNQGQVASDIVAIKTLKGFYDSSAVKEMLKECARMYKFNNPNVLALRGVCLDGGPAPYIIMPFMANGSLLAYLKKERAKFVVSNEDLDAEEVESVSKQLMDMCIQIARGMEYVARKKVVHRDLAARNCMIDVNFQIKVADFGLCESLETKEYFRQDKAAAVKLPVKWLAPESMEDYVFSEKSDVWAYGVTCWEIFSGGKVPYPNVDLMELPKLLRNGLRLDRPENDACNEQTYTTMLQCWEIDADKRPTFSALVDLLSKDLEVMANYLDLRSGSVQMSDYEATGEDAESDVVCQEFQSRLDSAALIDMAHTEIQVSIEESNCDDTNY